VPNDRSNALGSGAYGFHARSLGQAYLLGQLACLLEMRRCTAPNEQIERQVEALWVSVVELLGLTPSERAIALAGPPPDEIAVSGGVPVARWSTQSNRDPWRLFEAVADGDDGLSVVVWFRPAARDDFPPGTVFIEIHDPHHSAQACAVELLGCMRRDLDRLLLDPVSAWRRICQLRSFYAAVARSGVEHLPRDHYRDWNPALDTTASPLDMAKVVAERAATQVAQRNLTIAIAARWFASESVALESTDEHTSEERPARLRERLVAIESLLIGALDASNQLLLARHGYDPTSTSAEVVFAADADGLPVMAAIPTSAVRPPTPLTSPA